MLSWRTFLEAGAVAGYLVFSGDNQAVAGGAGFLGPEFLLSGRGKVHFLVPGEVDAVEEDSRVLGLEEEDRAEGVVHGVGDVGGVLVPDALLLEQIHPFAGVHAFLEAVGVQSDPVGFVIGAVGAGQDEGL